MTFEHTHNVRQPGMMNPELKAFPGSGGGESNPDTFDNLRSHGGGGGLHGQVKGGSSSPPPPPGQGHQQQHPGPHEGGMNNSSDPYCHPGSAHPGGAGQVPPLAAIEGMQASQEAEFLSMHHHQQALQHHQHHAEQGRPNFDTIQGWKRNFQPHCYVFHIAL